MGCDKERISVALLGILPPPNGGIASWTKRMLSSEYMEAGANLYLVDERLSKGRAVFGSASKRNLFDEIGRCVRIWKDLNRCIKQNSVDVVHANIPAFPLSMLREIGCAVVAKANHSKFVIHFRCTVPVAARGKVSRWILGRILSLSDAAIVLNQRSLDFVKSISDTNAYLIPNFVSEVDIPNLMETNFQRSSGPLMRVLYAGGLIEEKGVLDVIAVAKRLPAVEFRLAGEGDALDGLDVPGNVTMLGSLDKDALRLEYQFADAFLFLTRFQGEGFSNSLVEAMSYALPCVCTEWAANRDMVGDYPELVVPIRDVDSAQYALTLLDDPDFRREVGESNQRKVLSDYRESVVAQKYLTVYRGVCLGRN